MNESDFPHLHAYRSAAGVTVRHRLRQRWTGTPSLPISTASAPVRPPMGNRGRSVTRCPAAASPWPTPIER